ncbi:MAG: hypothetical protein NTW20_01140, partial [Rhodobacterales bacterium]|nr:hypothetical protein [Rhodobacterales bacterium]
RAHGRRDPHHRPHPMVRAGDMTMGIAKISAVLTAGWQIPLRCNLRAVPTAKMKSAREISLRARFRMI